MKVRAVVIGSKAIVLDVDLGNELFKKFFGKPFSVAKPRPDQTYRTPFVLSLYEALYLCEKGLLVPILNGSEATCSDLEEYCRKLVPGFDQRYTVFKDLRDRGYILRSGMKFGADFAVYEVGPGYEHAPYILLVVRRDECIDPISIVRIGRVGHSVRKRSVLAIVDSKGVVDYLVFKWVKL